MIDSPLAESELLDRIVARVIEKFHPRTIYLFGSRARGDARWDSDYDFLIEVERVADHVVINSQMMTWLDDFDETEVQFASRALSARYGTR